MEVVAACAGGGAMTEANSGLTAAARALMS